MTKPNFQTIQNTPVNDDLLFFNSLESEFAKEDGSTARANLAAGIPIYYRHELFDKPGQIIKDSDSRSK